MKILSFSAVEILPALLNKTKRQTIRPAWYKIEKLPLMNGRTIEKIIPFPIPKLPEKAKKEVIKNFKKRIEKTQNKIRSILASGGLKLARFKVGETIQLGWKVRGTPKDAKFWKDNGNIFKSNSTTILGEPHTYTKEYVDMLMETGNIFPKLLGTATIISVFQIEMTSELCIRIPHERSLNAFRDGVIQRRDTVEIAHRDGFKSAGEMFAYFDKAYDLSSPKKFWVYKWTWLS